MTPLSFPFIVLIILSWISTAYVICICCWSNMDWIKKSVYACVGRGYYLRNQYTELGLRMVWKSQQWGTPTWRETPVIDHRERHCKLLALQDNLMHAGHRGWWRKKKQDEFYVSTIFSLPASATMAKPLSLYCGCPLSLITFRRLKRAVRAGHGQ